MIYLDNVKVPKEFRADGRGLLPVADRAMGGYLIEFQPVRRNVRFKSLDLKIGLDNDAYPKAVSAIF